MAVDASVRRPVLSLPEDQLANDWLYNGTHKPPVITDHRGWHGAIFLMMYRNSTRRNRRRRELASRKTRVAGNAAGWAEFDGSIR